MGSSTLDITGEEPPVTTLGHGTGALGPSDSSDSGSDVVGGPGMDEGLADEQSREMPETVHATAGRDLGDPALDSDSDRNGTGERASSGIETRGANDLSSTLHPGIESASDEFDDPDAVDADQPDAGPSAVAAADASDDMAIDDDLKDDDDDGLDDVPVSDGAT